MASDQVNALHNSNGAEVAIAFVVESSLAVANDWVYLVRNYVTPMVRRLLDANSTVKPRMAFITYATADTTPSPLLCRRFFVDSPPVMREMSDSPTSLGIGTTNSGGKRGMAALEGIVAAIELFDVLLAVSRSRLLANHIFHIASASPDSSVHPRYNEIQSFDSITWEAMPVELKKAGLFFFLALVLCTSQVAPSAPKEPFFPTRPSHSVLLSGFPMSPQKPNIKRPADVHNTPDPKRARLAPPIDVSPKVQTPKTPSNQPKPSPIIPLQPKIQAPNQPQPQPQPQPQALAQAQPVPQVSHQAPPPAPAVAPNIPQIPGGAPPSLQMTNFANFVNATKAVEEQIRKLHAGIQNAQSKGNAALAHELNQELAKKQMLQQRFKTVILDFRMSQQQQAAAAAAQAQLKAGNAGQNQDTSSQQPNITNQPGVDQQSLAAMLHKRTASGSGPGAAPGLGGPGPGFGSGPTVPTGPPSRGPMPPQGTNTSIIAAQMQQMQKMADQQQRARMQPNMAGPSNGNAGMQPAGPPPSHVVPPVDQRSPKKGPNSVWHGSISFSGTDGNGAKKENVVWVVASSPNPPEESRTDTWPSAMPLQPASKQAVPLADLQAWIQQHRPVLCTFSPQTHGIPDPAGNEANFKALTLLLIQRKAYAVSAWTLPSGEQGNNILFFPVNPSSLGAACFPERGLPELPRLLHPQPQATPNLLNIDLNNPDVRARLEAMSPVQREQFMKAMQQQRVLHARRMMAQNAGNNGGSNNALMATTAMNGTVQHQMQPQQHSDVGFAGNVHPAGNYGGMTMMNTMGLGQQQQAMMAGMPRPVNSGMRNSIPSNINYEMMQSFMQRNPEGGGMGQ
ncbi:hypothetical protein H0H87_009760 [Tephrocybe sp. NHM501043]|nr:hypothetical protein H0H87_009760 [Tephrocybe sp. NHM501043]